MADVEPTYVQVRDRVVHTSSSGMEIIQTWYVEPYDAYPFVIDKLQGGVDKNGKRVLPMHDGEIPVCFCNEAVLQSEHPEAMKSADSVWDPEDLTATLQAKVKLAAGVAGAKITAHYRPLVSAWVNNKDNEEGETDPGAFDWIDVKFTPGLRQIPWPLGLVVRPFPRPFKAFSIPPESGQPMAVPVTDITIKRLLVAEVPWGEIAGCGGAINNKGFPPKASPAFDNFPRMDEANDIALAKDTVKFEGAEVQNMMDSKGNRWYEITYHFKWVQQWGTLIDSEGEESEGWVTWNHIFMNPKQLGLFGRTAWYEVSRQATKHLIGFGGLVEFKFPFFPLKGGLLHNSADFLELF